jgi:hypothetical protein
MILYLRTSKADVDKLLREGFENGSHTVIMNAVKMSKTAPPLEELGTDVLIQGEFDFSEEEVEALKSSKNENLYFIPAIVLTKTAVKVEVIAGNI